MSSQIANFMAYFKAGGPLMWCLLACSIVSLTVILERFYFWSRIGVAADKARAEALLNSGVMLISRNDKNDVMAGPICQMLKSGKNSPPETCSLAMEISAGESLEKMRRGMKLMDTIITAAPMLGILGTVTGIMTSFDVLGASSANHQAVVSGLAQALITTAYGLGISIGTVFPYNYFYSRIEEMAFLLEDFGGRLEISLACSAETGICED